jgi:hypothetical protein
MSPKPYILSRNKRGRPRMPAHAHTRTVSIRAMETDVHIAVRLWARGHRLTVSEAYVRLVTIGFETLIRQEEAARAPAAAEAHPEAAAPGPRRRGRPRAAGLAVAE